MINYFKYFLYILFIPFWWIQLIIPRKKTTWLFGAWYGKKYADNAKVLFEYVSKNQPEITPIWMTKNEQDYNKLKSKGYNVVLSNSLLGIYYSLKAGIVIVSSGKVDVNKLFINGAEIINTWHGAPMKKIGLDDKFVHTALVDSLKKIFFPFIYEFNISKVVSTSKIFDQYISSAFDIKTSQILQSGYPRNDIFLGKAKEPYINKLKSQFPDSKIIIYLPTFRDAKNSMDLFFDYGFNESKLNEYLEESNSAFLIKGHFAVKNINFDGKYSRIFTLQDSDVAELNPILKDCDILLTDYSGAYFDFLITGRPIIFTAFDLNDYLMKCRELYFDYNDIIAGPIAKNWDEVILNLLELKNKDHYESKRKEMNQVFNSYYCENSCKRLFELINNSAI